MRPSVLGRGELIVHAVRLAWLFFRINAMNELQYRVNFVLQLFQSLLGVATGLVALWLIFSQTSELHGWTSSQLLIVMGIFTMMGGIIQTVIQPNMTQLIGDITQGDFDYQLVKPADAQLLASVRQLEVWEAVDILTGLIVVLIGALRLSVQVSVGEVIAFVVMLAVGTILVYCFWMILTTLAFWVTNLWQLVELFQGVYNAGRYPVAIYPGWLRYGLTFLVPIAFAVTVPAEALTGRLNGGTVVLACVMAAVLLAATRIFWRFGLRRYSGASA